MVKGIPGPNSNSNSSFQSPTQRSYIILSFLLTFLLSLPFSYHLTKITRLALPSAKIDAYSSSQEKLQCPIRFPIHLLLNLDHDLIPHRDQFPMGSITDNNKIYADELDWIRALKAELLGRLDLASDLRGFDVPIDFDLQNRACIDWYLSFNHFQDDDDDHLHDHVINQNTIETEREEELLEELQFQNQQEVETQNEELHNQNQNQNQRRKIAPPFSIKYHLNLVTSSNLSNLSTASLSAPRNLTLSISNQSSNPTADLAHLASQICSQLSQIFNLPFQSLVYRATNHIPGLTADDYDQLRKSKKKSIIPYAKRIKLIFSLMNQDSSQFGYKDWEIESLFQDSSSSASSSSSSSSSSTSTSPSTFPTLLNSLRTLHDLKIETQIQYFSPLSFVPTEANPWKREETKRMKIQHEIEMERKRIEKRLEEERRWKEDERIRQEWEEERRRRREEVDRKTREEEERRKREKTGSTEEVIDEDGFQEQEREESEVKIEVGESDQDQENAIQENKDSNSHTPEKEDSNQDAQIEAANNSEPESIESSDRSSPPSTEENLSNNSTNDGNQPEIIREPPNNYSNKSTFLVEWQDLSIFINSAEWSLTSEFGETDRFGSSSSSNSSSQEDPADLTETLEEEEKVLHFILFVPSNQNRPLGIRDAKFNPSSEDFDPEREVELSRIGTQAWIVPQWGGVMIYNPEEEKSKLKTEDSNTPDDLALEKGLKSTLPSEDLVKPFEIFGKQLTDLIGLEKLHFNSSSPNQDVNLLISLENLQRQRILENLKETTSTLKSILKLRSKILNLGIGYEVRRDFEASLNILEKVIEGQSQSQPQPRPQVESPSSVKISTESSREALEFQGDTELNLTRILHLSNLAKNLSNKSFFNPNMLGMLYFPDEHKYAVLTPLFGPILVPILVAVVQEVRRWRETRKLKGKGKGKGKRGKESL